MTQVSDFGWTEDAQMLRDSAAKFFSDNFSTDKLHSLVAGDTEPTRIPECLWDQGLWQQMVDLGWTMLAVPEDAGGVGMGAVAVAGLVEELGRAAFPCPLVSTINVTYALTACDGGAADAALANIAEGASATLAITNAAGSWDVADTGVEAAAGKLNGCAYFVQDARKAGYLLVHANTVNGSGLYWLASDAAGVTVHADAIVDLTRDQAHVEFVDAEAVEVSADGVAALTAAFPAIWTVVAADMVGAAEWQLQTTVEYAQVRKQFDRPLGFFQAVKHPLVNVMLLIDQSKSLVYNAACAIDSEPKNAPQFAHMAKASASDMAAYASSRSVQFHGGIGFTWECFAHLYFKRQKHNQLLWGDAAWHRAKLADIVMGPIAA